MGLGFCAQGARSAFVFFPDRKWFIPVMRQSELNEKLMEPNVSFYVLIQIFYGCYILVFGIAFSVMNIGLTTLYSKIGGPRRQVKNCTLNFLVTLFVSFMK